MSRRPKPSAPKAEPTPLAPAAPGLAFPLRLLFSGAAPDLVLQAVDLGMFQGQDLNARIDAKPLVQHWVDKANPGVPGVEEAGACATPARLDWPVATDPTRIRLPQDGGWVGQSLWWEHAAIALVRAGVDPLAPWRHPRHANLLQWAHANNRPWLLDACLKALPPELRQREVQARVDDRDENPCTRLHQAMGKRSPLLAQVWFGHGADLHARDGQGATPIFRAASAATLEWALSAGARATDVDDRGQLPSQAWRNQVEAAGEWAAMQSLVGMERARAAPLLQAAVAAGDVEAFMAAHGLLDDPSALMPDGRTVLGHVAAQALKGNGDARARHSSSWRASVGKMLRYLWSRTDFQAAQSQDPATHVLNDLQLAWVAGQAMEKAARSAARRALARTPFVLPGLAQVLRWADRQLDPDAETPLRRPRALLRAWVGRQVALQMAQGALGVDEILGIMAEFHATHHPKAVSYSLGSIEANVWAPLYARVRDGLVPMSDDKVDQVFAQVLLGACQAVAGEDVPGGSRATLAQVHQGRVRALAPDSHFGDGDLGPLAACVLAWSMLGGKPPPDARQALRQAMEDSGIATHPDFQELGEVWAWWRAQDLDARLEPAGPGKRPAARL